MTTPALPVRFCPVCKTADDHPRHDFFGTDPNVAPHMDCCAERGCPDGSCDIVTRSKGDKVGAEFRAQITNPSFSAKTLQLLDERDDATRHFTLDDLDPNVHGALVAGSIELNGVSR